MRAQSFPRSTHDKFRPKADVILKPFLRCALHNNSGNPCQKSQAQNKADQKFRYFTQD